MGDGRRSMPSSFPIALFMLPAQQLLQLMELVLRAAIVLLLGRTTNLLTNQPQRSQNERRPGIRHGLR
ncbi:hypothetical protein Mapa_007741 [Marchantia paleacea]|nr:hypothetical protein Mapa_007741 [Marchantia paleacea]